MCLPCMVSQNCQKREATELPAIGLLERRALASGLLKTEEAPMAHALGVVEVPSLLMLRKTCMSCVRFCVMCLSAGTLIPKPVSMFGKGVAFLF
jgi:hypothetical protein